MVAILFIRMGPCFRLYESMPGYKVIINGTIHNICIKKHIYSMNKLSKFWHYYYYRRILNFHNFSTPCNVVNIMGNCDHIYSLLSIMIKIRDVTGYQVWYPTTGYLALVLGWLPDIWKNPDTGFDIRLDTGYLNKISPRYTRIFSLRNPVGLILNLIAFWISPGPAIYLPVWLKMHKLLRPSGINR